MKTADQEPGGEYPKNHSLSFVGPSHKSLELFNYHLGYNLGATPWSYPKVDLTRLPKREPPIEIARAALSEGYPVSEIVGQYLFYEYENSPYAGGHKHVSGYEIEFHMPLRNPQQITEVIARKMLVSLNQNTGMGEYRQLPNGKHQIVIPGEGSSTILELGYYDLEKGIAYLQYVRDHRLIIPSEKEYVDKQIKKYEKIKQQKGHIIDEFRVRLKSDEVIEGYIDKGDNNQIEGGRGDVAVRREVVDEFFNQAAYLIEAVSENLGERQREKAVVAVEYLDVDKIPGERDDDIMGRPPFDLSRLFKSNIGLDDVVEAAGKALDNSEEIQEDKTLEEKRRISMFNSLNSRQINLFIHFLDTFRAMQVDGLTEPEKVRRLELFEEHKRNCLDAGIPESYLSSDNLQ